MQELTEEQFYNKFLSGDKAIIVIGATWCATCKMLTKTLLEKGVDFFKVDVDNVSEFAVTNQVRSLPTTILLDGDFNLVIGSTVKAVDSIIKFANSK